MTKGFKICAGATGLYLIFLYVTNIYYGDDLMRSYYGYMLWTNDGRPFSDLFYSMFVQFGSDYVPDIFPLPIILTGAIFSYVTSKAVERLCNPGGAIYAGVTVALLCNPFVISNFLFRYDGAFMLLALACAIAPHALSISNQVLRVLASAVLLTLSFGLYQASVNVFIGLSFIALVCKYVMTGNLKASFKSSAFDFMSLIIAYTIYSKIILPLTVLNDYFSNFNKLIPLSVEGVNILFKNIIQAKDIIKLALHSGLSVPLCICIALSLYCLARYAPRNKFMILALYLVAMIGVSFFAFGIVAFGQNAAFFPRVFMGFGCFLAFNMLFLSSITKHRVMSIVTSLVISLPLLIIFFAALNASRQEYEYQNNIASMIVRDINSSSAKNEVVISVDGDIKRSPVAQINSRVFPVLDILLPKIFMTGYDGGRLTLMRNGLHEVRFVSQQESGFYNSRASDANVIAANSIYSIYHVNNVIVIKFN
ncbi:glucosyltransferase domain-containing protein [Leclercia adecarboxylata]|uniref:glucosyltransferase domain-containing protein n=1 Tax=Leclercia adecarboxylata TaxID=83655 RepID=UPI002B302657|nr:glucosyltransferase domain-containing protein [Leclercia adecarboxylata]